MRLSVLRFAVPCGVLVLTGGLLAGCLPSSQRSKTSALLPSDSLSVQLAAGVTPDTLTLVWTGGAEGLELPTSIAWVGGEAVPADTTAAPGDSVGGRRSAVGGLPGGRLVVADTRHGSLRLFAAADGRALGERRPGDGLAFPYLAGTAGDTAVVLLRGENRLAWVPLDGPDRLARTLPVPEGTTAALATPRGVWAKRADEDGAWFVRLDARGGEAARYPLPGPVWRRFGFLRAWGDSTLSLSGYRPVVDVLTPDARGGAVPDSMLLVGFDSPQLLRSHQFMRGEVDQPPLLTSSAVAVGDRLYVVNLRADGLRVDVFGRDGRLQRALVFLDPEGTSSAFPIDLAVREDAAGGVWIALAMQNPGGIIARPGGHVLLLRGAPGRVPGV